MGQQTYRDCHAVGKGWEMGMDCTAQVQEIYWVLKLLDLSSGCKASVQHMVSRHDTSKKSHVEIQQPET